MTSSYRRDHIKTVRNDELAALTQPARDLIEIAATSFEGDVAEILPLLTINNKPLTINTKDLVLNEDADGAEVPLPSSGEKLAMRRAMARLLIDSGIASARGWL